MSRVGPTFGAPDVKATRVTVGWGVNGDTPSAFRIYTDPFDLSKSMLVGVGTVSYTWTGLRVMTTMNLSVASVYENPPQEVASAITVQTTAGIPVPPHPPAPPPPAPHPPPPIGVPVGGLIGDKWRALGAQGGPLGMPASNEDPVPGRNGRRRSFDAGQIVWSPDQGPNMVVAVYVRPGTRLVTIDWGPTTPYNYDLFIVRWDRDGNNVGQDDIRSGNRTAGVHQVTVPNDPGTYAFMVEGCDAHTFGSTDCKQGWTVPALLRL